MKPKNQQELLTEIYREVGEQKTQVRTMTDRLEQHISMTQEELKAINALDAEQNRILDAHIAGVNTLKEMHVQHREEAKEQLQVLQSMLENQSKDSDERLKALERPYDLIKYAGKVIMWVGGISGAILAITKFFKVF